VTIILEEIKLIIAKLRRDFFFLAELGFELRASYLLGRCSKPIEEIS
jgi:hypothetical protein